MRGGALSVNEPFRRYVRGCAGAFLKRGRCFIFVANPGTLLKAPQAGSSVHPRNNLRGLYAEKNTALVRVLCAAVSAGPDSRRGLRKKRAEFNDVKHLGTYHFPFNPLMSAGCYRPLDAALAVRYFSLLPTKRVSN